MSEITHMTSKSIEWL